MPSVRDYSEARRARPLPVEDRQSMIVDAVIPLLLEFGREVTSKQIAEAAGIAEGTVFRAFGDKETLIAAAVDRYLDPTALRNSLRAISRDLSLDDLLREILVRLQDRFSGVIRMMAAAGMQGPPPGRPSARQEFAEIIGELLDQHRPDLRVSPQQVAQFARLVALASSIPALGQTLPFTADELIDLFKHGVMKPPAATTTTADRS